MSVDGLLEHNIDLLRQRGIAVTPVSEPWLRLYDVAGYGELTERQVLDLTYYLTTTPQPPYIKAPVT